MSKLDLLSPVVLPGQSLEAFVAWFAQQRRAADLPAEIDLPPTPVDPSGVIPFRKARLTESAG